MQEVTAARVPGDCFRWLTSETALPPRFRSTRPDPMFGRPVIVFRHTFFWNRSNLLIPYRLNWRTVPRPKLVLQPPGWAERAGPGDSFRRYQFGFGLLWSRRCNNVRKDDNRLTMQLDSGPQENRYRRDRRCLALAQVRWAFSNRPFKRRRFCLHAGPDRAEFRDLSGWYPHDYSEASIGHTEIVLKKAKTLIHRKVDPCLSRLTPSWHRER